MPINTIGHLRLIKQPQHGYHYKLHRSKWVLWNLVPAAISSRKVAIWKSVTKANSAFSNGCALLTSPMLSNLLRKERSVFIRDGSFTALVPMQRMICVRL